MAQPIPATLLLATALATFAPRPALADPANTLKDLWTSLNGCLAGAGPNDGWELTLVFSLKRDGALLGKPRVTYAKLPPDQDEQKRITENIARAMNACLPISITDGLGGAIAGRPITIRLVGRKAGEQGI